MSRNMLQIFNSPLKSKLLLMSKIPIAYLSGVRIYKVTDEIGDVRIRFKFLNQNPFRSMYFACMSMAAEMSTGALAMHHSSKGNVSMLVANMEASFTKKAIGKIIFKCKDGKAMEECIQNAISSNTPQTFTALSIGTDEQGDEVARFKFTWTFKSR